MTRRNHGDIPPLRAGCFPQTALPNPPHDITACGDNLMLTMVPVHAFDVLPAISVPDGQTTLVDDKPLIEAVTGNGWRCYLLTSDTESLMTLLNLASAGRFGVQAWMRGEAYDEAWTIAENSAQMEANRRAEARRQNPSPDVSLPDLDDIEI